MTTERKRRPVFQEQGTDPVTIEPPFQPAETFEDLVGEEQIQSPVKDPEIDNLNGWKILTPKQQDGRQYLVAATMQEFGLRAFWRKTRVLDHFKWVMKARWTDSFTRNDLAFEPVFYKDIN